MIRFELLCLLVLTEQYAAGSPHNGPGTEYDYQGGSTRLRLHIVPAPWSDASTICQLEGGVLATPSTSTITRLMLTAMDEHKLATNSVFVGVTSYFSKGSFKSLDGADLAQTLEWATGEPDNVFDAEACVALTGAGALADVSCGRLLPFFCKAAQQQGSPSTNDIYISSTTPAPECGNTEYTLEPRTGSCYKFHGVAKTWRQALATCHAEGGHLAIINTGVESAVLATLYNEEAATITGADQEKHAFIGFKKFDDDFWGTIYGESLADAGFETWSSGEPSNGNGLVEEKCGSMHKTGLLNDACCTYKSPFICEITP